MARCPKCVSVMTRSKGATFYSCRRHGPVRLIADRKEALALEALECQLAPATPSNEASVADMLASMAANATPSTPSAPLTVAQLWNPEP
ncbi:hypothetical protein Kuura_041 [Caulobacter phage Kuura]|nr:hypothetical protein Kuura_041 [Caulobacter phage Kuura]